MKIFNGFCRHFRSILELPLKQEEMRQDLRDLKQDLSDMKGQIIWADTCERCRSGIHQRLDDIIFLLKNQRSS